MLNKKSTRSKQLKNINYKLVIACFIGNLISFYSASTLADESPQPKNNDEVVESNNNIYLATFFDQYLPQNAFEMVARLPGFNFDGGSNERGFGGNAGNVLIDGKRPTSKSGGLRGALIRIPSAKVERIEILRGGISGGEAAGQSVIANVIKKQTGSAGSWAAKLRRAPDGEVLPNIEAAITTQLGSWQTAFDLDFGGGPGYRVATIENRDVSEQLLFSSDEIFKDRGRFYFINGEGAKNLKKGQLTLNGRVGGFIKDSETTREIYESRLPDDTDFESFTNLKEQFRFKEAEFSIDWLRTINDWKWHTIGLGLVNGTQYKNAFSSKDLIDSSRSDRLFSQDGLKTEFITRLTLGYVGSDRFKPEYGIEFARNKLTSELEFEQDGLAIELNGSNVVVTELRSEVFASFTHQLNTKLSFEGGLTAEFSQIEVLDSSSINEAQIKKEQNFQFIKPRLSATYKLNKKSQTTIEVSRRVGQLNFNDFAASSQAGDNQTTAGNPDLAPDIIDTFSASYDLSFSKKGSIHFELFHEWRSDILERIILPSGDQGLGNAGDAEFWGMKTGINLPMDNLLDNGLIKFSYTYNDSSFDDPIINQIRTVGRHIPKRLDISLRQDIIKQQLSWGIDYNATFKRTSYLVNEIQTFQGNERFLFFIETSRYFGVKTQLEITHANTGDYTRSRFFYDGDRGNAYLGSEISRRHRRPEIKLSFSGTF